MKFVRSALILALFAALLAAIVVPSAGSRQKAAADTTINFADVHIGKITPGAGQVGVDIWWPSNGSAYLPCQHSSDIYYGSCILSNQSQISYYKVMHFNTDGTNDFPYGVFIDNTNQNYCKTASWCTNKTATSFNHGWGRLISDTALEVYPYLNGNYDPSNNTVGGVRIGVECFPVVANGGRYSSDVGDVSLPQIGQSGVAKLNGFVTNNGTAVSSGRVRFEAFQTDTSWKSSTGYPVTGFTSVTNTSGGYYNTGALPAGTYKIYITDTQTNHKITIEGVGILLPYDRLDFQLEKTCFGHPDLHCTDPAQ